MPLFVWKIPGQKQCEQFRMICQQHTLTESNNLYSWKHYFIYIRKKVHCSLYELNFLLYTHWNFFHVTWVVNLDLLVHGHCNKKFHKQIPAYFGFLKFKLQIMLRPCISKTFENLFAKLDYTDRKEFRIANSFMETLILICFLWRISLIFTIKFFYHRIFTCGDCPIILMPSYLYLFSRSANTTKLIGGRTSISHYMFFYFLDIVFWNILS